MKIHVLLALAAALTTSAATGATIGFEGFGGNTIHEPGPAVSDGYSFSSSVGHFHFGNGLSGVPSNGTSILLQDRDATITMTKVGGGTFSLLSGDLGEDVSLGISASSIRVTGFFSGGGSTFLDVLLDGNSALFQNAVFAGFTNLTSVTFTGLGGPTGGSENGFTLDNLEVSDVPEPSSLILVFGGLAAFAAHYRRRAA